MRALAAVAAVLGAVALWGGDPDARAVAAPAALRVEVVRSLPHDPGAFTQGLELSNGRLLESTGLYGRSSLRELDPRTGRVLRSRPLAPGLFGEGLTVVGGRVLQLTWRERRALVWERRTLRRTGTLRYPGEGWGACFDGRSVVVSDGSSRLSFRDPRTFRLLRRVRVVVGGSERARAGLPRGPVARLNELECVGRSVYANVWQTDAIVRIDAATGVVTAVVDASGLLSPAEAEGTDVLNGIAHDPGRGLFLVTGKLWPRLFEVRLVPRAA